MLVIHQEVAEALAHGGPIVALESAVITTGLPREPLTLPENLAMTGWNASVPANLALAQAMEQAVRACGAVPATVAIIDSTLHIGLGSDRLQHLALDPNAGKASVTDLAHQLSRRGVNAGTTVSGTLAALHALHAQNTAHRIRTFATGGIGGVHQNWIKQPDISADLLAIASSPTCVVCSGGKSILDLPATLEALEALTVPVLGYRTHLFPQFQSLGTTDLRTRLKVDDVHEAARICKKHWNTLHQGGGVLLANPVPESHAVDMVEMTLAVAAAEREARKRNITGAHRTPFLLNEIARLTNGKSLRANVALLVSNAALAAELAIALCKDNI